MKEKFNALNINKKGVFITIFVGTFIIYGMFYLYQINLEYQIEHTIIREEALRLAQEHVDGRFQQEMIYIDYGYYFSELSYIVKFSPKNNPDLIFFVYVKEINNNELTPQERLIVSDFDDYYEKYLEYELNQMYESDIKKIWGIDVKSSIWIADFQQSDIIGLHEFSTIEDAENILNNNYTLYIDLQSEIGSDGIREISQKIWRTLEIVKTTKVQPIKIYIDNVGKDLEYFRIAQEEFYGFKNISDIEQYLENR